MNLFLQQFGVLLWKCWLIKKRHYFTSLIEFFLPLLTSVLMVITVTSFKHPTNDSGQIVKNKSNIVPSTIYNDSIYNFKKGISKFSLKPIKILITPDDECRKNFSRELFLKFKEHKLKLTSIKLFKKEDDLTEEFIFLKNKTVLILGIVFENDCNKFESFQNFSYKLRTYSYLATYTNRLFPVKLNSGPTKTNFYLDTSFPLFVEFEILINQIHLENINRILKYDLPYINNVYFYKYPYPGYIEKPPVSLIDFLPTVIIYGFIVFFPVVVKRMTEEKENNVKQMFKLVGLNNFVYFGSTFVNYFIVLVFQMLILTILYSYPFSGQSAILTYSNPILIYIILLVYGINLILMAMLISIFFNKPVLATIVALIVYYITNILHYFFDPKYNFSLNSTPDYLFIVCFFPNVAINFLIRIISLLELYGNGANFSNIFETTLQYGFLSVGLILIVMVISSFIYCILIWYLDNVWSFNNNLVKPWYFPLNFLFKIFNKNITVNKTNSEIILKNNNLFEKDNDSQENLRISIQNLYKKFGKKTVISNISLNIYSGKLVALLGQNGAGKTTLMNMICGMFPPSKGKIFINNYNIETQTNLVRKSISLCPQHNVLYPELTAEEHLYIYGLIKNNVNLENLKTEIKKLLQNLNLYDKINIQSKKFSGGMKRKLNLAISLIGNSKIVILDEPTSGMDPEARRSIWDVLLEEKKKRAILLTTHFIEEADILGDKIFIMSQGIAKCYGSPMFLKRIYGLGYQLRIAKKDEFDKDAEIKNNLTNFITKYFKYCNIFNENVKELIYCLDSRTNYFTDNRDDDGQIAKFFKDFENNINIFEISTFGITIITLEDVFLKILDTTTEQSIDDLCKKTFSSIDFDYNNCSIKFNKHQQKLKGYSLFLQRLKALLIKRLNHSKRYYLMILFQIVIPLGMFYLIFYLDNYLKPNIKDEPNLQLNINNLYGQTNTFFSTDLDDTYEKSFENVSKINKMNFKKINFEKNLTNNINSYLLNVAKKNLLSDYIKHNLVGATINKKNENSFDLHVWFNNEAIHSLPISILVLFQTLKQKILKNLNLENPSLTIKNNPFPNKYSFNSELMTIYVLKIMWTLLVSISLPFLGASYSIFPIHENITKSKLLQLMTGCNGYLYWISTFIYDFIMHFFVCCLILILIQFCDVNYIFLNYSQSMLGLFLLLFIFGLASMQIAYIFSRNFKSVSSGFLILTISYLVFGVILSIIDFLLTYLIKSQMISSNLYNVLIWFFRFFPIYSMSKGIVKLYELDSKSNICKNLDANFMEKNCKITKILKGCCPDICDNDCYLYKNPFQWQDFGILKEILVLSFVMIIGFIWNIVLEENGFEKIYLYFKNIFNKKSNSHYLNNENFINYVMDNEQDSDVIQEKKRVNTLMEQRSEGKLLNCSLVVDKLTKVFDNNFVGVNKLTFILNKKECFGLLGINGAGKTTTFKMLVGDIKPTSGNAYTEKFDLINYCKEFQRNIGYCPQFDALLDKLTGEEMLYLFGRLRGINEKNLSKSVLDTIKMIDLSSQWKNLCSTYSGGNKRKLSLGLALIGLPQIIFLDEPTTGVDSEAKRKIWSTLTKIKQSCDCSIILTSHSMEECEALCSRIAIMVKGKFKCLNSIQNLRKKYGKGFSLSIKIKHLYMNNDNYLVKLKNQIYTSFSSSILKDYHNTFLNYQINDTSLSWAFLFEEMNFIKTDFDLEYYLFCDTTLEQIFINFAKSI